MFPSLSAALSDSPFTPKLMEDILKRLHHLNTHFLPPLIQLDASTLTGSALAQEGEIKSTSDLQSKPLLVGDRPPRACRLRLHPHERRRKAESEEGEEEGV